MRNRHGSSFKAKVVPLLTNCGGLPVLDVLAVYKSKQPFVDKRHDLLKNTLEVTLAF